jgi:hypothetical protein
MGRGSAVGSAFLDCVFVSLSLKKSSTVDAVLFAVMSQLPLVEWCKHRRLAFAVFCCCGCAGCSAGCSAVAVAVAVSVVTLSSRLFLYCWLSCQCGFLSNVQSLLVVTLSSRFHCWRGAGCSVVTDAVVVVSLHFVSSGCCRLSWLFGLQCC